MADLCQIPGCSRPRNHSQLHNVIEALEDACDMIERADLDSMYEIAARLRAVGRRAYAAQPGRRSR